MTMGRTRGKLGLLDSDLLTSFDVRYNSRVGILLIYSVFDDMATKAR